MPHGVGRFSASGVVLQPRYPALVFVVGTQGPVLWPAPVMVDVVGQGTSAFSGPACEAADGSFVSRPHAVLPEPCCREELGEADFSCVIGRQCLLHSVSFNALRSRKVIALLVPLRRSGRLARIFRRSAPPARSALAFERLPSFLERRLLGTTAAAEIALARMRPLKSRF